MMKIFLLLTLLLSPIAFAGGYSKAAQDLAETLLETLEKNGEIKSIDAYTIIGNRFYDGETGKKALCKAKFARIQIPEEMWLKLNKSQQHDMLHILKLYTRTEADKFTNGEKLLKYI